VTFALNPMDDKFLFGASELLDLVCEPHALGSRLNIAVQVPSNLHITHDID